jgi:hypothetical protein
MHILPYVGVALSFANTFVFNNSDQISFIIVKKKMEEISNYTFDSTI